MGFLHLPESSLWQFLAKGLRHHKTEWLESEGLFQGLERWRPNDLV
jgi:hypothetical protein